MYRSGGGEVASGAWQLLETTRRDAFGPREEGKEKKKIEREKPSAVHRTEILKCAATMTSFDGLLIAEGQGQQGENKREIIKIHEGKERATCASGADDPQGRRKGF